MSKKKSTMQLIEKVADMIVKQEIPINSSEVAAASLSDTDKVKLQEFVTVRSEHNAAAMSVDEKIEDIDIKISEFVGKVDKINIVKIEKAENTFSRAKDIIEVSKTEITVIDEKIKVNQGLITGLEQKINSGLPKRLENSLNKTKELIVAENDSLMEKKESIRVDIDKQYVTISEVGKEIIKGKVQVEDLLSSRDDILKEINECRAILSMVGYGYGETQAEKLDGIVLKFEHISQKPEINYLIKSEGNENIELNKIEQKVIISESLGDFVEKLNCEESIDKVKDLVYEVLTDAPEKYHEVKQIIRVTGKAIDVLEVKNTMDSEVKAVEDLKSSDGVGEIVIKKDLQKFEADALNKESSIVLKKTGDDYRIEIKAHSGMKAFSSGPVNVNEIRNFKDIINLAASVELKYSDRISGEIVSENKETKTIKGRINDVPYTLDLDTKSNKFKISLEDSKIESLSGEIKSGKPIVNGVSQTVDQSSIEKLIMISDIKCQVATLVVSGDETKAVQVLVDKVVDKQELSEVVRGISSTPESLERIEISAGYKIDLKNGDVLDIWHKDFAGEYNVVERTDKSIIYNTTRNVGFNEIIKLDSMEISIKGNQIIINHDEGIKIPEYLGSVIKNGIMDKSEIGAKVQKIGELTDKISEVVAAKQEIVERKAEILGELDAVNAKKMDLINKGSNVHKAYSLKLVSSKEIINEIKDLNRILDTKLSEMKNGLISAKGAFFQFNFGIGVDLLKTTIETKRDISVLEQKIEAKEQALESIREEMVELKNLSIELNESLKLESEKEVSLEEELELLTLNYTENEGKETNFKELMEELKSEVDNFEDVKGIPSEIVALDEVWENVDNYIEDDKSFHVFHSKDDGVNLELIDHIDSGKLNKEVPLEGCTVTFYKVDTGEVEEKPIINVKVGLTVGKESDALFPEDIAEKIETAYSSILLEEKSINEEVLSEEADSIQDESEELGDKVLEYLKENTIKEYGEESIQYENFKIIEEFQVNIVKADAESVTFEYNILSNGEIITKERTVSRDDLEVLAVGEEDLILSGESEIGQNSNEVVTEDNSRFFDYIDNVIEDIEKAPKTEIDILQTRYEAALNENEKLEDIYNEYDAGNPEPFIEYCDAQGDYATIEEFYDNTLLRSRTELDVYKNEVISKYEEVVKAGDEIAISDFIVRFSSVVDNYTVAIGDKVFTSVEEFVAHEAAIGAPEEQFEINVLEVNGDSPFAIHSKCLVNGEEYTVKMDKEGTRFIISDLDDNCIADGSISVSETGISIKATEGYILSEEHSAEILNQVFNAGASEHFEKQEVSEAVSEYDYTDTILDKIIDFSSKEGFTSETKALTIENGKVRFSIDFNISCPDETFKINSNGQGAIENFESALQYSFNEAKGNAVEGFVSKIVEKVEMMKGMGESISEITAYVDNNLFSVSDALVDNKLIAMNKEVLVDDYLAGVIDNSAIKYLFCGKNTEELEKVADSLFNAGYSTDSFIDYCKYYLGADPSQIELALERFGELKGVIAEYRNEKNGEIIKLIINEDNNIILEKAGDTTITEIIGANTSENIDQIKGLIKEMDFSGFEKVFCNESIIGNENNSDGIDSIDAELLEEYCAMGGEEIAD